MNLVVTRECNRACSYCFAKRRMVQWQRKEEKEVSNVSVRDVEYFLSFLSASGIQEFRILGGEPSLHPEFVEIVQLGLKRGFEIFVFTNGLWPDSVQRFFDQCQDGRIRFIFNLNEPETETLWENDRQKRSLEIVGGRGSIGFNMYRSNFDLKFVVDIADTFSLKRAVRIGLAQPIVRKQNDYLNSEELRAAGKRLAEQLEMLEERDVIASLDCGFTYCMFDPDDWGKLVRCTAGGLVSHCSPVIDVAPDLSVWPCYPLDEILNVRLTDFRNCNELIGYYERKMAPLRAFGTMDACLTCKYLRRLQCCGGCLARTIRAWEEHGDSRLLEKLA